MMLGQHMPTIDSQYRISFPAKFRGELGEEFLIVRRLDVPALRFYSLEAWDNYLNSFHGKMTVGEYEDMELDYYSNSVQATPDSLGRVRIPKELWESINVDFDSDDGKKIVVIGCRNYGEIWKSSELAEYRAGIDKTALNAKLRGTLI